MRHVPIRLCDVQDVPLPESLYLMGRAFQGFYLLYQAVGKLKPFDDMVCIDEEGVVKVWLSADLSMSEPEGKSKKFHCPGFADSSSI